MISIFTIYIINKIIKRLIIDKFKLFLIRVYNTFPIQQIKEIKEEKEDSNDSDYKVIFFYLLIFFLHFLQKF
jgi:hypothetical protein